MPHYTFTSDDIKAANHNKDANAKIFPELENPRQNADSLTDQFDKDIQRGIPTIFKNQFGEKEKIFDAEFVKLEPEEKLNKRNDQLQLLKNKGLSAQQMNDYQLMTNQGSLGALAGVYNTYIEDKFTDNDRAKIQMPPSGIAQLEFSSESNSPTQHLIYKTATKITFDKDKTESNYQYYGPIASNEITSKDYMIITAKVDLGPVGAENYQPKVSCSIKAEGKIAQVILDDIKKDVPITNPPVINQNIKEQITDESIEKEYKEIFVKNLETAGYNEPFANKVKQELNSVLSGQTIQESRYAPLKEFKSTPKLFAEVLVDRISEVNKIENDKDRSAALNTLSENAANFVDQPKRYMKILVKDAARQVAESEGQNLPKEGVISKISKTIKLMIAKINAKFHGKTDEVKQTKELLTKQITNRSNNKKPSTRQI